MFNLFFSVNAKRNDSELSQQIVKGRQADMYPENKSFAKLYYIKWQKNYMYSGIYLGEKKCIAQLAKDQE